MGIAQEPTALLSTNSASSSTEDVRGKSAQETQVEQRSPSLKRNDLDEADETVVLAEGEDRTTSFVWFLVIAAATGGLLFGFDVSWGSSRVGGRRSWRGGVQTGVIGGALVHKDVAADLGRIPLKNFEKEVCAHQSRVLEGRYVNV
jgi:SP family myo-inositol transporter-like MFS transporter 13